jgi:hypothetical protein
VKESEPLPTVFGKYFRIIIFYNYLFKFQRI